MIFKTEFGIDKELIEISKGDLLENALAINARNVGVAICKHIPFQKDEERSGGRGCDFYKLEVFAVHRNQYLDFRKTLYLFLKGKLNHNDFIRVGEMLNELEGHRVTP